jgi:hypothetical protein
MAEGRTAAADGAADAAAQVAAALQHAGIPAPAGRAEQLVAAFEAARQRVTACREVAAADALPAFVVQTHGGSTR